MGAQSGSHQHGLRGELDANMQQAATIEELLERSAGQALFTRDEVANLLHELRQAQHALQVGADGLSLALDSARGALWTWDSATDRFQWSSHLQRNWGIEPASLRTMADWRGRIHPDDVTRVLAEHGAAISDRRAFAIELRLRLPDGQTRWVVTQGRGVYDNAGNLTRVAGVLTDITPRKAAEAAQHAGDARIRAQWESSPVASFIWKSDGVDFLLVEVNPAAERMTHGKAHEFLGLTAAQIYPDRPDMLEYFQACLMQKEVIRYTSEYHARGTGLDRVIEFTFAYMAPDSVLLHTEDVTESRRAETDLMFTQAVVDQMNDAAYWATEDGRLVYVNEAACAMLGYTRDELLALCVYDAVDDYSPVKWQAFWDDLKQNGGRRFETRHRRKDGSIVPVEVQTLMVTSGGRTYACAIARDVRERKAMEAALRAGEAKFSALFELSPVALTITRVADGVFLDVNDEFLQLSGFARSELIGHTALDLKLYAEPAQRDAIVAEVRRTGHLSGWPVTIRTKDGTTSDCLMSVAIEAIDGVPCFLAGIVHIGPLRQAEEALRASEAKFSALFELSPVGLAITRVEDGVFVGINSAFAAMTGYKLDDLLGHTALERHLYARPADRATIIAEIARNGQIMGYPAQMRTKDGVLIDCLLSMKIVAIDGVSCYLAGFIDMSAQRQAEAALRAQQADMLAMLENTDSSIWSIDRDYRLTAGNSFFRRNVRASLQRELAVGDSVLQSDDQINDEWRAMYERALAGERLTIEVQRRHSERGRWMEYRLNPVRSAGGEVTGVTVLGRDITEQMRAAQVIREQLAEISLYYDTAPVGLAVFDKELRYLKVNKMLAAMNGIPVEKHLGRRLEDVLPALGAQLLPVANAVLDSGEPVIGSEGSVEWPPGSGEIHWFVGRWYPFRQEDGTIVGVNAVLEDITARKMAQIQLERSRQNLARAQQIGRLGNWEWDIGKDRLEWSAELYRIFGVDKDFELTFAGIEAMIHPDDRELNDALVAAALGAGDDAEFEFRIIRPDGEVRHIYQSIEITRNEEGAPVRFFGIMQDISERNQAADERERLLAELAQAQKMESVGRLAGGIAHDFNNMLAVILMRTEMALQMAADGTPLHRSLTAVFTTAERSAKLVQQLLGFARKQTIAPKAVNLNEAVPAMLPMLGKLIGEEIEIRWQPGDDLWMVKVDPSQLDQILTNLCVNARDAIDGIGKITIATANTAMPRTPGTGGRTIPGGDYVVLSVADTGRGIAPDVLEHIFEPFFTTKGVGKGTGLGLATVEGIVEQNRGHIRVASTPGLGTTFTVYLPCYADPVAQLAQPAAAVMVRGDGHSVLLVEDELAVLDMAGEALRSFGFKVFAFSSPAAALRTLQDDTFTVDLLVTDVIMPEMNGALLAERVRQHRPAIKTLFVSGYPADYMADRGILPDAAFLAKPFSRQSLAAKVAEVLGLSPA